MRELIHSISAFFLSLFFTPLSATEPNEIATIVDAVGSQAVTSESVVGVSIGISRGGKLLYANGYGLANVELDVKASTDSVYRIGSITKQFTAAAILLLVEDEKIELDDPLKKFFPDYPKHGQDVTVAELLSHTSGIKDFTRLPTYRTEQPNEVTPSQVIDRFQNLPLDFEPGEKFQYCNSGYFLLGAIVEQVAEQSFEQFLQDRLFKTAKLKHTYSDKYTAVIPNRTTGYSRWNGNLRNAPYLNMKQTTGAGDLVSTVTDLLLWNDALMNNQILRPETTIRMTTKGKLNNGKPTNYALGLFVRSLDGNKVIRHGGGINGYRAELAYFPDSKLTIAVLANSDNAQATRLSDRIAKQLLAQNKMPDKIPDKTPDEKSE
jgi:D-alanyl-D-alanine carboxypeptidase